VIDLEAARALLDFGKRIGDGPRAEDQLRGAVAIHNLLRTHGVAYLADEVGMGKTYVALGALALFRHFEPGFRVLVIAPRENIQKKWQDELVNFASNNVRFSDLRVRALDGRPARPLVSCGNLLDLVKEASLDPDRDFFVRMSSFSLPLGRSGEDWSQTRDALRAHLPWLRDEAFDLRNKERFKRNFARALCCALPRFDLVIVDEAHNLKHGASSSGSSRNQVLAEAFGRPIDGEEPSHRLFPGYGPRAARVLFLSATPLEETYRHLWNQLDVFGFASGYEELRQDEVSEFRKKELAAKFLVRRVTSIRVAGRGHTKNMYRRDWRSGGVATHDDPIAITDERQRLIVALVQKKVSELLSGTRFKRSFQIGMLASFESFLETAKLKRDDDDAVFDDAEQTDDEVERDGVDVADLNKLARSYRKHFDRELPHPKMDAVVESLAAAWSTGRKALVFVRRVASVKELKRKLDERYDEWIIAHLRGRLPEAVHDQFDGVVARYQRDRAEARAAGDGLPAAGASNGTKAKEDVGGKDTFFAWFFRGEGPRGIVSGANIQARFVQANSAYATFFADNHVMALLGAEPGGVLDALAAAIGATVEAARVLVRDRAAKYLSRTAKVIPRGKRMEAAQAAALELLRDGPPGLLADHAGVILRELFPDSVVDRPARQAPDDIVSALERQTLFTELRRAERMALRARIWPAMAPATTAEAFREQFREQSLRADLLATAARLGHAFIDLYVAAMAGRTTLSTRRGAESAGASDEDDDLGAGDERLLRGYLRILEAQLGNEPRPWAALDELSEIATNFELIVDCNLPKARNTSLIETSRQVAGLLREQQPTGGMAGQVNQTVVRQFRMPGYPMVLVTTDLLQEGEDLHTFCSAVHHYGISWTPSAMEQRIGRIDRVRSQSERRLSALEREPLGNDWLQVYFPYLQDTVEVLQVERVLDRMNTFLHLMHENLSTGAPEGRRIDIQREMVAARKRVATIREPLKSAFPVSDAATRGSKQALAVAPDLGEQVSRRLAALARPTLGTLPVAWADQPPRDSLLGTATLKNGRIQPFRLLLRSEQGHPVVRCLSPIGRTEAGEDPSATVAHAATMPSRLGAILTREARQYDLTVEDDVVLRDPEHDAPRVALLVRRVVEHADRMEQAHFEDGRDTPIDDFDADLRKEGSHED
jgi:superfamily II DNA or RNA helicase